MKLAFIIGDLLIMKLMVLFKLLSFVQVTDCQRWLEMGQSMANICCLFLTKNKYYVINNMHIIFFANMNNCNVNDACLPATEVTDQFRHASLSPTKQLCTTLLHCRATCDPCCCCQFLLFTSLSTLNVMSVYVYVDCKCRRSFLFISERPIHSSEKILDVTMKWANWPQEFCQDNFLCFKFNKLQEPLQLLVSYHCILYCCIDYWNYLLLLLNVVPLDHGAGR